MKSVRQDLFDQEEDQDPSGSDHSLFKKKWKACLKFIEKEIPWQTFKTWFIPIMPVSFVDEVLILRVPSRFFFEWLESHFSSILNNSVEKVFGEKARVEYLIAPSPRDKQDKSKLDAPEEIVTRETTLEDIARPETLGTPLDPRFTFNNFFVYRKNSMAKKAAEYVAVHLENNRFNPLCYFGDSGTGKTHLLNAIGNHVCDVYPGKQVINLNGGQFIHEYVSALQKGKINNFKEMLIDVDVFLLDDVHYFANKMKSQENLLYVISQLLGKNKIVVITSNLPPNRLPKFNPRLISTFKNGLIVDLSIPEHNTREKIIQYHLDENGIRLPMDIVEFLTEKFDNMHNLNAALIRICAQVSLLGSSINLDECRKITSHLHSGFQIANGSVTALSRITVDKIIRNVAAFFEIPPDLMSGNSRIARIVLARQIAMYISRKYTGESFTSIGYHFGNRTHATILYACNKIQSRMRNDAELENMIETVMTGIFGMA
jgi:chromosomal replication initiator protein